MNEQKELFEQFWNAGMRKVNKKKAKQAFFKIMKSENMKEALTLIFILDIDMRLTLNQFGFSAMHPTTYLNGERWKDDYPEEPKQCNKLSTIEQSTQVNRANHERTLREIAELEAQGDDGRALGSLDA